MKVSVIIPVYNAEKFLKKTINSVLSQTYSNLEIILINDGSTDNSRLICENFKKADNRIKLINKENAGVSSARNDGINLATGTYITFVDSDDYINRNFIESAINIFKSKKVDLVKFNFYKKGKHFKLKHYYSLPINEKIASNDIRIKNIVFNSDDLCPCWGIVYKSSIAKKIRFDKNIKVGEDFLYVINYLKNSKTLFISNERYYYYVINQSSVTHSFNLKKNIIKTENALYVNKNVEKIFLQGDLLKNNMRLLKSKRNIMSFINNCIDNCNYSNFIEALDIFLKNDIINQELTLIYNNCLTYKEKKILKKDFNSYLIIKVKLFLKKILKSFF